MTLIHQRSGGVKERRCDARCHDAKKPDCDCICGGAYHGKGSNSNALYEAIKSTGDRLMKQTGMDASGLRAILEGGIQAKLL